jgi:hypothetical protein
MNSKTSAVRRLSTKKQDLIANPSNSEQEYFEN